MKVTNAVKCLLRPIPVGPTLVRGLVVKFGDTLYEVTGVGETEVHWRVVKDPEPTPEIRLGPEAGLD